MKEALTGAPFAPQQSVQRCCVRGKMVPLVQQQDVNRRRVRFMNDKVYDHDTKQQKKHSLARRSFHNKVWTVWTVAA